MIVIAICLVSSATLFAQEEMGVKVGNTIWATRYVGSPNTFVDKPEDYGMFYQWNGTKGWTYPVDINKWDTAWSGNNVTAWKTDSNVCPTGWRLPTITEIKTLIASGCFMGTLNGIKGNFFVGNDNKLLFFPFGTLNDKGSLYSSKENYGNIWGVSDTISDKKAYNMGFNNGSSSWSSSTDHAFGLYVRCVKKEN